jgi:hypothetical protein
MPPRHDLTARSIYRRAADPGDRAGYEDGGAVIEAEYTSTLGQEPRVSPDGRLLFYDLRPWARGLRTRLTKAEIDALRRKTLDARAAPPGALT